MMKLVKKVNIQNLYTDFVNILNGILQLSKREAEVFSLLLYFSDNGHTDNVNSKVVRNNIKNSINISEPNLSKYLNVIKQKGLIVRSGSGKWVVNDNIKPLIQQNKEVEITFVLKVVNNKETGGAINGTYVKGKA